MFDLKKSVNDKKLITKVDIKNYIIDYVDENNLSKQVNKLTFEERTDSYGHYQRESKTVNIPYQRLLESYINKIGKPIKEMDTYDFIILNSSFLNIVNHELTHAMQVKILNDRSKDIVILKALQESFENVKSSVYKFMHDDYIIEYNAKLEVQFKILNILLDNDLGEYGNFLKPIYDDLIDIYSKTKCPLENYNYLVNSKNKEFFDNYDYSKISTQDKILYGLPITTNEKEKIKALRFMGNTNLYKFF